MVANEPLQPVPDGWTSALAIVAHPDDLEYGAASAIAGWTSAGKTVSYLLVTHGEAGIDSVSPEEAAPLREAEQLASAAVVGVDTVEFLDGYADGLIEYGLGLRQDLCRAIRRHRPDVIITGNRHDTWGGTTIFNMADHRHVGLAVIDAARDAANRWIWPELGRPWQDCKFVLLAGSPQASHYVDIGDSLERGVESLRCHAAYLADLEGIMADPEAFLHMQAEAAGAQAGCKHATLFELV